MKSTLTGFIVILVMLLWACKSSRIVITSKKDRLPVEHGRIMVVAALPDTALRVRLENDLAGNIGKLGYVTVTAFGEFGQHGLANMEQEATYIKLRDRGIDAILVITLIDKKKERKFRTRKSFKYPDNYYYERIWNYKKIGADFPGDLPANPGTYFWEAILFNLNTLEAECTIQSSTFSKFTEIRIARDFEKQIVQKMVKEKVLQDQKRHPSKPF